MIRKYLIPALALIGASFAIFSVVRGSRPVQPALPVATPAYAPFSAYVAGAGIVEAFTENISIGTPVGNIVEEIFVQVGDAVRAGDPLFKLRDKVIQAEVAEKKAAADLARAKLERLRSLPRPEDVPPLEAKVQEAEANLNDQKNTLAFWESVTDQRAVSRDELSRRKFAVAGAESRLAAARAELQLLKAGSWKQDIQVSELELEEARAVILRLEADSDRRTIRAPVDGQVMQVKIHPGEYAQPGPLATPLMLLGNVQSLIVRIDVDEHDAWRVRPGARAEASIRGNASMKTALQFVRIEPYIVPKKSLTGDSTERVDTRVLQVIYKFQRSDFPIYVGQQMDVFLEAAPMDPSDHPSREGAAAPGSEGGQK